MIVPAQVRLGDSAENTVDLILESIENHTAVLDG